MRHLIIFYERTLIFKLLIFFALILHLCSCSQPKQGEIKKHENCKTFEVDPDNINNYCDEIVKSAKLIPLEFNNNSIINSISKIIPANGHYIIFDKKENNVLIFDTTGTYKSSIKRFGKGPHEYRFPRDIVYNYHDNTIGICAQRKGEILWFNFNAEPVSSNQIDRKEMILDNAFYWDKNLYHFIHNPKYPDAFQLNITDLKLNRIKLSMFKTNINHISRLDMHPFNSYNKHVTLHKPYDHTIYQVNLNGVSAIFEFEFGKKTIPSDILENILNMNIGNMSRKEIINQNKKHKDYVKIKEAIPLKDYILLNYSYKFQAFHALIHINTGNYFIFRSNLDKLSLNDYVGSIKNTNTVYFSVSPTFIKKWDYSESEIKIRNKKMINKKLNDDNIAKNNPWLIKLQFQLN